MNANPYNLPKTVVNAKTGEKRVVRTAVDYQNLLGRGYADAPASKAPAAKPGEKAPADK